MEDWRADRDRALEPADLGIDTQFIDPDTILEGLHFNAKTSIFEEDERKMSNWTYDSRRTSVGWTIPPREQTQAFINRNVLTLGIEDQDEQNLLGEIIERDRGLLDKTCCSEDVIRVWNYISVFIIRKLKEGSGVQIPGLYTITFQTEKSIMPLDTQYYVLKKIPVMIMSRFLIETYCLRNRTEDEFVFRAPSVPLDLTEIARMSKLTRNVVDGAIIEVLHAFARALICNKKLEFPLPNIGKLQVDQRLAVMKFYQEFYTNMGYHMESSSVAIPYRQRRRSSGYSRQLEIPPLLPQEIDLNFDILPGQMTPLRRHIPTETYRSVFHLAEVRSVHEDELLAPVEVNDRARVHGKFQKSVLPAFYPVDLQERILYLSQENDPFIHESDEPENEFELTPTTSPIMMECQFDDGSGRFMRLCNPDGTEPDPETSKSVWDVLQSTGFMNPCEMPDGKCAAKKLNYMCQAPPRFLRAKEAPIPKPKEDMTWPGIKHTGMTPVQSLESLMAFREEESLGEYDEDEGEMEEFEELEKIRVETQKIRNFSEQLRIEAEKFHQARGSTPKSSFETEKMPDVTFQTENKATKVLPVGNDNQTEKLYLIIELNGEEKVFWLEEVPTCESMIEGMWKEQVKADTEKWAAEASVTAMNRSRRRSTVHDLDAGSGGFKPTQLYSVKPTGKFTIDMLMGNRNLYLDILFNHHHKMCADVLGIEECRKHFARRAKAPTQSLSYD